MREIEEIRERVDHSGISLLTAREVQYLKDIQTLLKRIEELERERDLALAHDTQPYPTANYYEKEIKNRIEELEAQVKYEQERNANNVMQADCLYNLVARENGMLRQENKLLDIRNKELEVRIRPLSERNEYLETKRRELEAENWRLKKAVEKSYELLQTNLECNRGKVSAILKEVIE